MHRCSVSIGHCWLHTPVEELWFVKLSSDCEVVFGNRLLDPADGEASLFADGIVTAVLVSVVESSCREVWIASGRQQHHTLHFLLCS